MKKTVYGLTILVGVLLLTSGCGKIPVLKNGEEAIYTVNGSDTAISEFYNILKEKYGVNVVIDMIDKAIFEKKYKVTDDETAYIDEQIASLKSSAEQNNVTYEYLLNYYGFQDEAAAKEYLSLNYRREQATKDYVKTLITDKEINAYYKNNVKGDVNAKHILISLETADGMTEEETSAAKKEALKKAKNVIKKLQAGEDWAKLAKEYSADTSNKDDSGNLGWFNTGKMEEAFEKAAYALKKGTFSTTPVETTYGYHIIYKIDEKAKPKLEDVKSDIIDTLVDEKLEADSNLQAKALEKLRKDAGLEIHDDELKSSYSKYLKSIK